jgi:hypothetical protein
MNISNIDIRNEQINAYSDVMMAFIFIKFKRYP